MIFPAEKEMERDNEYDDEYKLRYSDKVKLNICKKN